MAEAQCYTAPATSTIEQAAGRTDTFIIYIAPGCPFLAFPPAPSASKVPWIVMRSDIWYEYASAAAFAFDVAQNTGAARTGTIVLGGITFTVRQMGASDTLPITGSAVPSLASLDTLMRNDMKEFGALGGALAVSYKGRLVYARGFGYADRASLEKAPPTIHSGRELLSETNPELDRLIPELLLGQVNYPSNQLNVTSPEALSLAREWESAFAQMDVKGQHAFRFTNITGPGSVDTSGTATPQPALPNLQLTPAGGVGPQPGESELPPAVQFLLGAGR